MMLKESKSKSKNTVCLTFATKLCILLVFSNENLKCTIAEIEDSGLSSEDQL